MRMASKITVDRLFDVELLLFSRTTPSRAMLVLVLNVAIGGGLVDKTAFDGGAVDDATDSASMRPPA